MFNLLMLMFIAGTSAEDVSKYCGLCTPGGVTGDLVNHTACLYEGIGPGCTDYMDSGVTEEEKELILQVHNWLRSIKWDDELAKIAQLWADQCRFEHDCRHVEDFKVGQNIAQFWNDLEPTVQWKSVIQGFTGHEVMTAHYTQVVWGNTRFVGCGRRAFRNGPFYVEHYVCNYGPAGNIWFRPMYAIGEPCSRCPEDSECNSSGVLCEAGAGARQDIYSYRYAGKKDELEFNVTAEPAENEVSTDTSSRDKELWDEWYRYIVGLINKSQCEYYKLTFNGIKIVSLCEYYKLTFNGIKIVSLVITK
ncbi:hypothetical protein C0J52_09046 [Blattella germanica]|nr:hypothetical protein C0J52_09046 [Blattella germanica]